MIFEKMKPIQPLITFEEYLLEQDGGEQLVEYWNHIRNRRLSRLNEEANKEKECEGCGKMFKTDKDYSYCPDCYKKYKLKGLAKDVIKTTKKVVNAVGGGQAKVGSEIARKGSDAIRKAAKDLQNSNEKKKAENNEYIKNQRNKHTKLKFTFLKLNYNHLNDESKEIIKKYKLEDKIKNFDFDKIKDKNGVVIKKSDKKGGDDIINIKPIKSLKIVNGVIYDGKIYRGGFDIIDDNGKKKLIRVVYDDKQNVLDVFMENHKSDYDKRKDSWIKKYKELNENKAPKIIFF
jgi:hypothetical protein